MPQPLSRETTQDRSRASALKATRHRLPADQSGSRVAVHAPTEEAKRHFARSINGNEQIRHKVVYTGATKVVLLKVPPSIVYVPATEATMLLFKWLPQFEFVANPVRTGNWAAHAATVRMRCVALNEDDMTTASIDSFLRRVLTIEAVTCVGLGLLLSLGADLLSPLLEVYDRRLPVCGTLLFPIAAFVAWVATDDELSLPRVRVTIIGNLLWVGGSVVLLVSGWISLNLFGTAFIVAQAIAVTVFAALQYIGWRKIRSMLSAAIEIAAGAPGNLPAPSDLKLLQQS